MLIAVKQLNLFILARHAVLLGYYPEVEILLRTCWECTTRMLLFWVNIDYAKRFIDGHEIGQSEIDKALSKVFAKDNNHATKDYNDRLRRHYAYLSDLIHPLKIKFLNYRVVDFLDDAGHFVKDNVTNWVIGGIMPTEHVIRRVLQCVLFSLMPLGKMFREKTGQWDKGYSELSGDMEKWEEAMRKLYHKDEKVRVI